MRSILRELAGWTITLFAVLAFLVLLSGAIALTSIP